MFFPLLIQYSIVSGGLDSTLMSVLASASGIDQYPLFVDYGQLCVEQEWKACRRVHLEHGLPKPLRMSLSGFGATIPSGLTDRSRRINEDAFLPGRNLLFLFAGAAYAYSRNADGVAIGLLSEKYHIFPDQTSAFLAGCARLLETSLGRKIRVVAPLMRLSKRDVLKLCRAHRIGGTYSCHSGGARPCGQCVSCLERQSAERSPR